MAHFVITANRTADGGVVYLTADRAWTTRLADAAPLAGKADGDDGLAWARTQEAVVCDPHLIKAALGDDGPAPLDAKQRIRADGPEAVLARLGFLGNAADADYIHRAELPDGVASSEDAPAKPALGA